MLIQLAPDKIGLFWDGIKHGVIQIGRLGKGTDSFQQVRVNKVLESLLSGKYQCWILCDGEGEGRKFHAFALTYVYTDNLTGEQSLMVDVLYGFRMLSDKLIEELNEGLTKYAKTLNCSKIRAITDSPRVVEIMSRCGMGPELQVYCKEV